MLKDFLRSSRLAVLGAPIMHRAFRRGACERHPVRTPDNLDDRGGMKCDPLWMARPPKDRLKTNAMNVVPAGCIRIELPSGGQPRKGSCVVAATNTFPGAL